MKAVRSHGFSGGVEERRSTPPFVFPVTAPVGGGAPDRAGVPETYILISRTSYTHGTNFTGNSHIIYKLQDFSNLSGLIYVDKFRVIHRNYQYIVA